MANETSPLGTTPVSGGNATPSSSQGGGGNNPNATSIQSGSGAGSAPSVLDLSEDSMVRLPGAKDPVRYGDYYRGFQSEFTKRSQEAANAKREIAKLRQQVEQSQRTPQPAKPDPRAKLTEMAEGLKSLTYLNGQQAADVVGQLTAQFADQANALQQRDLALGLMYKRMTEMGNTLNTLHSQHATTSFDSKISQFVKTAGLPDGAKEFAKAIYLAHEGEDLDREFPKILKTFWDQTQNVHKTSEAARLQAARRAPFVPGKGGNGSPSKPLANMARASAREIADAVWPGMVDGESGT